MLTSVGIVIIFGELVIILVGKASAPCFSLPDAHDDEPRNQMWRAVGEVPIRDRAMGALC